MSDGKQGLKDPIITNVNYGCRATCCYVWRYVVHFTVLPNISENIWV